MAKLKNRSTFTPPHLAQLAPRPPPAPASLPPLACHARGRVRDVCEPYLAFAPGSQQGVEREGEHQMTATCAPMSPPHAAGSEEVVPHTGHNGRSMPRPRSAVVAPGWRQRLAGARAHLFADRCRGATAPPSGGSRCDARWRPAAVLGSGRLRLPLPSARARSHRGVRSHLGQFQRCKPRISAERCAERFILEPRRPPGSIDGQDMDPATVGSARPPPAVF